MQRLVQLPGHIIPHRPKQWLLQLRFMPGRLQILGNQPQRPHPHRHIAHLLPLPFNAKLQHPIAPLQIPHFQLTQFLSPHPMIGQRGQNRPIPFCLEGIPLRGSEECPCLFIAEGRRGPFLAVGLWAFHPIDGIMQDRIVFREIRKQRG